MALEGLRGLGGPVNYYESMVPDFRREALMETQNRMGQQQVASQQMQNAEMQRQLREQDELRQALPSAMNDPAKLQALAIKYPSQLKNIQAQLGFRDAQDVDATEKAVNALQQASAMGPEAVANALVRHAEVIQQKGATPQQLMQMWSKNPQEFNSFLGTVKLGTLGAKDQFDIQNDQAKLAEAIRSNRAGEGLTARGQDITVRGQNISAQNAMRSAGGATPASVREYQYFNSLSPEQQKTYLRVRGRPDAGGDNTVQLADGRTVSVSGKLHGAGANAFYEGTDDSGNMVRVPASAISAPPTSAAVAQNYAMKKDIDTIANADSNQLDFMTGITGGTGSPAIGADVRSRLPGNKEQRQLYNATRRIQGRMQNQGVAAAKDMGASGINTIPEARMYFQSMPQLDYSSPEAMQQSLRDIQEYTDIKNKEYELKISGKKRQLPSEQSQQAPVAQPQAGFSSLWGE